MNAREILRDLVEVRGALIEIPRDGQDPILALVGHFELLDDNRAFWFEAGNPDQSGGHLLKFASYKRLHALAVGFYDAQGEFVAYLTQIREAELPANDEAAYQSAFATWKKKLADPKHGPKLQRFLAEIKAALTTTENPEPENA